MISTTPDTTPGTATARSRRRPARAGALLPWLLTVLVALVVLVAKSPDAITRPQFWAEDGEVFFAGQAGHAVPHVLDVYAGYLLVVPRLTAWAASAFPTVWAPLVYNLVALALGAVSLASLRELGRWSLSLPLLLASVALTPTNGEVFGTLTNVQWFTQFYLLVAVVRHLHGASDRHPVARAVAMVAVALTGPLCLFAVAALLVGYAVQFFEAQRAQGAHTAWRPRPTPEMYALVAGAVVQLATLALFPPTGDAALRFAPGAAKDLLASVQAHVLGRQVMATELFLLLFAALVLGAAFRFRAAPPGDRAAFAALLVFVGAQFVATTPKAGGSALLALGAGDRYFVLLKAAFWWFAALSALALCRNVPVANLGATALLLVTALVLAYQLARQPLPDGDWPGYAAQIDAGASVTVPIAPPGWSFSCATSTPAGLRCEPVTLPPTAR